MNKLVAAFFALALITPPAVSQGMRDSYQGYQEMTLFLDPQPILNKRHVYALFGDGSVHWCNTSDKQINAMICKNGRKWGVLNQRFRSNTGGLYEHYIENGNLVQYSCREGAYMECNGSPNKTVMTPW